MNNFSGFLFLKIQWKLIITQRTQREHSIRECYPEYCTVQSHSKISSRRVRSRPTCGQAFDQELHVQRLGREMVLGRQVCGSGLVREQGSKPGVAWEVWGDVQGQEHAEEISRVWDS